MLTDQLWQRVEPHLPGKGSDSEVAAKDSRLSLEAIFWRAPTGYPWHDLPPGFSAITVLLTSLPI
ncbi:transposase [Paracoccus albus]|uniref:transposase n=1 Tax=Paracoccus albus TaxID=3017784 RepID=UPI0022F0B5F9|nr:transposase [Paracoccus albus]WBU60908.1 transposase [Paracoccus albus]